MSTEDEFRAALSARLGIAPGATPLMPPGALPGYFSALPGELTISVLLVWLYIMWEFGRTHFQAIKA